MYTPKTSDEAVKKATGKNWAQWFALLDKSGAKKKPHREIVQWLFDKHLGKKGGSINVISSGGWWSQMVTVEYERTRGIRLVNQNETGFLVAIHKTTPYSVKKLQTRWDKLAASKAVASKKLELLPSKAKRPMRRYKAAVGQVVVTFDARGTTKSRIMVEPTRLPSKADVERERTFWRAKIDTFL
jgi:hypothetical protein